MSERSHPKGSLSNRPTEFAFPSARFLKYIIKMDNTHCMAFPYQPYLYLVPQLKKWFPHIPQHCQTATVPFGSTSAEILFPVSLLGLLTLLASNLGFSLPGILQMTEVLNRFSLFIKRRQEAKLPSTLQAWASELAYIRHTGLHHKSQIFLMF